MTTSYPDIHKVTGSFVELDGERFYAIGNVDEMPPFLMSLVSDKDHWMFIASNGGLTAGRVSPETALFPYVTVDKLYDATPHTGCRTLIRVDSEGAADAWEPFREAYDSRYQRTRNLYKNVLGDKLVFEEINHTLGLAFRYRWATSDRYGFVRTSELQNLRPTSCGISLVDGLQNLLPAGTPRFTQTNSSYLVDAYKWSELDEDSGLALLTLFSGISDRAEPCESLRATTVFQTGLDNPGFMLSNEQLAAFQEDLTPGREVRRRGVRAAYFVYTDLELAPEESRRWQIVADVEQTQADAVALIHELADPAAVAASVEQSIAAGSDALARIMAAGDGFQTAEEEHVTAHHYANVVYNILRGGIVDDQYRVSSRDFSGHLRRFNREVYERHEDALSALPEQLDFQRLCALLREQGDPQLDRLTFEYLPITFGRRHGDPSRPWNQFAIRLEDPQGGPLLAYQGNWRDIFQNWEALLLSYPAFIESVIAKFVNASTPDGYNPYRITHEGIDWEVEDPEDPWSYIGYWGDHQIIYLEKLLELSAHCHPGRLVELLDQPLFSYANVPYRIRDLDALLADAKNTVDYDEELAALIERRVDELGADGKLVLDAEGQVYRVTLLEKLLVSLLAKLGNLVVDGGIWLNTQRPEWNDANNALVGQGLSLVTLCYMRRYVSFLRDLLVDRDSELTLSTEVERWLEETADALSELQPHLGDGPVDERVRYQSLIALGGAASRYRMTVYAQNGFSGVSAAAPALLAGLLDNALAAIDHSIRTNRRADGLYHAYNLLGLGDETATIDTLHKMLEGQVAVLSSGAIPPSEAIELIEAMFRSELFRPDQSSFLLYPDRELPGFLEKNRIPADAAAGIPLLATMLDAGDRRIVERDADGVLRFNADLRNAGDLDERLDSLVGAYGPSLASARKPLHALYEAVFDHNSFTGRSGGMFGFEGLGSIYWHMVGKLLLAVQEVFFAACREGADETVRERLAKQYYRVRAGLGFNKTPAEYGAFPTDPYSHTPRHAGAQQPGMTGQVKEEMLTRYGELGMRIADGALRFEPSLLRAGEFLTGSRSFRYVDVDGEWDEIALPEGGLAFTCCQVPIVYRLSDIAATGITVHLDDGERQALPDQTLPESLSREVFLRRGRIRRIELNLTRDQLCSQQA
jgi:hypothetical protein